MRRYFLRDRCQTQRGRMHAARTTLLINCAFCEVKVELVRNDGKSEWALLELSECLESTND
jgi:hypothetical protein